MSFWRKLLGEKKSGASQVPAKSVPDKFLIDMFGVRPISRGWAYEGAVVPIPPAAMPDIRAVSTFFTEQLVPSLRSKGMTLGGLCLIIGDVEHVIVLGASGKPPIACKTVMKIRTRDDMVEVAASLVIATGLKDVLLSDSLIVLH